MLTQCIWITRPSSFILSYKVAIRRVIVTSFIACFADCLLYIWTFMKFGLIIADFIQLMPREKREKYPMYHISVNSLIDQPRSYKNWWTSNQYFCRDLYFQTWPLHEKGLGFVINLYAPCRLEFSKIWRLIDSEIAKIEFFDYS